MPISSHQASSVLQTDSKVLTLKSMLDQVTLPSTSKFLDVGFGTGDLTIFIANELKIRHVYGVDIDECALARAKEKGIVTFKVDVSHEKLPFHDDTFDLVVILLPSIVGAYLLTSLPKLSERSQR